VSCPSNAPATAAGHAGPERSWKGNPRESGRIPHLRFPYAIAALGVFDGHAGDQAAAHLVAAVPSVFAQALQAAARGVPPPPTRWPGPLRRHPQAPRTSPPLPLRLRAATLWPPDPGGYFRSWVCGVFKPSFLNRLCKNT